MSSFSSFIFTCFMLLLFVNIVSSQEQIVSVTTIPDGGVFNITCDASRLTFPAEDSSVTDLLFLFIDVLDSNSQVKSTVAQYYPSASNPAQRERKNVPTGRNWAIEFNGGNNGTTNRKTMRIDILVRDARCTDAGLYTCRTQYMSAASLLHEEFKTQNVSAEAAVKDPVLTLVPLNNGMNDGQNYSTYDLSENITMTCRVDGPDNLVIKWKREVRPAVPPGITYEFYPYQNDISVADPTMTGSSTCQLYTHKSNLKFSVSDKDKKRIYLCVAQVDNVDVITTGATIDLNEAIQTPSPDAVASAGSKPDNIGLIVGVVIGSIAAIIIVAVIIGVVCYRRRSKRGNNTDKPDGVTSQHEPYSVSTNDRRQPGYNGGRDSRMVPTGRTNDALNTSYDSANKGPPVYAISNNNNNGPPRQKEISRGRQNTAYENEDRQPRQSQDPDYYNYDNRPQTRRYSTEPGTEDYPYDFGDPNMGTGV